METGRQGLLRLLLRPQEHYPIGNATQLRWFAPQGQPAKSDQTADAPAGPSPESPEVLALYRHSLDTPDGPIRYAFHPATGPARGLVVHFHGHDAFIRTGPRTAWRDFDVIGPLDAYGWDNKGSYFYGQAGDNRTERMVAALIRHHCGDAGKPWFGLRSAPASGHMSDGGGIEAQVFFNTILDRLG